MTDKLPPNLLQLFAPRPALRFLPPSDFAPEVRTTGPIDGLAQFLPALQEEPVPYEPTESWLEKKDREKLEKQEHARWLATEGVKQCMRTRGFSTRSVDIPPVDPENDPKVTGNALKTLFVGRLPFSATDQDLEREFGRYGPIRNVYYSVPSGRSRMLTWGNRFASSRIRMPQKSRRRKRSTMPMRSLSMSTRRI